MRCAFLMAMLLACATANAARVRAVRVPAGDRILWIGAHPDDEGLVAPILGRACVESRNKCDVVVLTNGSAVRAAELQRAAANLHAGAIQLDYADVFDITAWGPRDAIVARLASMITAERPTIIYTFDPRHGSSCHPAHRETGQLVLDAVASLGAAAPAVMLVETIIERNADSRISGFSPATPAAISVDATSAWHYLVDDAIANASQFDDESIALLRAVPAEEQRVWLLPSKADVQITSPCP